MLGILDSSMPIEPSSEFLLRRIQDERESLPRTLPAPICFASRVGIKDFPVRRHYLLNVDYQ